MLFILEETHPMEDVTPAFKNQSVGTNDDNELLRKNSLNSEWTESQSKPFRQVSSTSKHRILKSLLGRAHRKMDHSKQRDDMLVLNKDELHEVRQQLGKRIQKEKGRDRMEDLVFYKRLEKKEQKDIMLEAKTILLSMKAKEDNKIDQQNREPSKNKSTSKFPESYKKIIVSHGTYGKLSLTEYCEHVQRSLVNKTPEKKSNKELRCSIRYKTFNNFRSYCEQFASKDAVNETAPLKTQSKLRLKSKEQGDAVDQITLKQSFYSERNDKYRSFLNKINAYNGIYTEPVIKENQKKLYYYVGKGNNSMLIRGLMKRRFWWTEGTLEQANFVWTQLKKIQILEQQSETSEHKKLVRRNSIMSSDECKTKQPFKARLSSTHSDHRLVHPYEQADTTKSQLTKSNLRKVQPRLVHNHLPGNCHLGNKKALFLNLRKYCQLTNKNLFQLVPLTFHIGQDYRLFEKQFKKRAERQDGSKYSNLWIVKPGQNSNRGQGIQVVTSVKQLDCILQTSRVHHNGQKFTYIVQEYMSRPFLYHRRKFDIRHYMLITSVNGILRAYWYKEGYIRTSSQLFDLDDTKNTEIHLTNDAIQKYSQSYGKFEDANKLSYSEFQRYLDMHYRQRKCNFNSVLMRMKDIATEAVRATYLHMDPTNKEFNFEIFGLDFMLDESLRPWLIEINTNPCLELSSNLLSRIIPGMVQQAFRISLDTLFPPGDCSPSQRHSIPNRAEEELRFEWMFSSEIEGEKLTEMFASQQPSPELVDIEEEEEEFHDDGKEFDYVQ